MRDPFGWRALTLVSTVSMATVLTGCPGKAPTTVVVRAPGPQVTAFSESSQVTAVLPVSPYALVGTTRGLDRYDLRSGEARPYEPAAGLPSARVIALGASTDRAHVWALTEAGLVHLDALGVPQAVVPPAGVDAKFEALAVEPEGAVWLGGKAGLFRAEPGGKMWAAGFTKPVTALAATRTGDLWIGTTAAVVLRRPNGATTEIGAAEGVALARVVALAEWPDGAVVAIGTASNGGPRLAFVEADGGQTFRPSPETPLLGATRRGGDLVLLTPTKLYALSLTIDDARLTREGLHLVGVGGAGRSPVDVRPLSSPPPTPTVLAGDGMDVLVGTRALGTARVGTTTGRAAAWLRRRDLVSGARRLTVACETAVRCFIATGAGSLWLLDETGFAPFDAQPAAPPAPAPAPPPPAPAPALAAPAPAPAVPPVVAPPTTIVLAVARAADGTVFAVERIGAEPVLRIARLEGGAFVPVPELVIEVGPVDPKPVPFARGFPQPVVSAGPAGLSFARVAPDGHLWLGLTTDDEEGDPRPAGIVTVDLAAKTAVRAKDGQGGALVPEGALDVAFASATEMWFATHSGAARVKDGAVEVFGEAEGLENELLRAVIATTQGVIYAASGSGVSVFEGGRWRQPPGLRTPAGALAGAPDGRVWIGTARGLFVVGGQRVQRVDERLGLADRDVRELAVDHLGRVWTLGGEGLSIVEP